MIAIAALAWPVARVGEAIAVLAERSGLGPREVDLPPPPDAALARDPRWLSAFIEAACERIAVEAEPVEAWHRDVSALVSGAPPALFMLPGDGDPRLVAVLAARGGEVTVLAPDLTEQRVPVRALRDVLAAPIEAAPAAAIEALLDRAGVPASRRARARARRNL